MKKILFLFCCILGCVIGKAQNSADKRSKSFDGGWRFLKDSIITADDPQYDDSKWRTINLPHDWSIEDLPNQTSDSIIGPFSRSSIGQSATGFTVGGTGWYRKKFTTAKADVTRSNTTTIFFNEVFLLPGDYVLLLPSARAMYLSISRPSLVLG
jgi:beta-galactosidase